MRRHSLCVPLNRNVASIVVHRTAAREKSCVARVSFCATRRVRLAFVRGATSSLVSMMLSRISHALDSSSARPQGYVVCCTHTKSPRSLNVTRVSNACCGGLGSQLSILLFLIVPYQICCTAWAVCNKIVVWPRVPIASRSARLIEECPEMITSVCLPFYTACHGACIYDHAGRQWSTFSSRSALLVIVLAVNGQHRHRELG